MCLVTVEDIVDFDPDNAGVCVRWYHDRVVGAEHHVAHVTCDLSPPEYEGDQLGGDVALPVVEHNYPALDPVLVRGALGERGFYLHGDPDPLAGIDRGGAGIGDPHQRLVVGGVLLLWAGMGAPGATGSGVLGCRQREGGIGPGDRRAAA